MFIEIDNFFENPKEVREAALKADYYNPSENDNWIGLRADIYDDDIRNYIVDDIKFQLNQNGIDTEHSYVKMYYSLVSEKDIEDAIKNDTLDKKNGFDYNVVASGIIYLNENPKEKSGTTIYFPIDFNGTEVVNETENKWNKFIMYYSGLRNKTTGAFGSNKEDMRMGIVFFVYDINI